MEFSVAKIRVKLPRTGRWGRNMSASERERERYCTINYSDKSAAVSLRDYFHFINDS